MAVYKCKMCGGNLEVDTNITVAECEYCGTQQTLPKANDEVIQNLFNRANNLRIKGEFEKAEQVYESILRENESEAEAHWGMVLCKYGIEYIEDPKTFKRIPTCHRASYDAITTDAEYMAAIQHADKWQKSIYEAEAKALDAIQKDIFRIVKDEKPIDVFICYKETDENGKRTADSVIANDIYHQLTQEGLTVFYSAITLEDKLGQEYEPYIFAALNSAKVMLVIGTQPLYFSSVWVKNEWSRFLKLMKDDRSKLLIPCYKDMDAYDLPEEFSHLQAQDMGKIGFVNDIVRGIKKVTATEEAKSSTNAPTTADNPTAPLLKRVFLFLEDADWNNADAYCEKVLDIDPECAEAYVGKLMAELRVKKREALSKAPISLEANKNYQKAIRFGDEKLKEELVKYHENSKDGFVIEDGKLQKYYGPQTSVIIPNNVTAIGDQAFFDCKHLISVTIPNSVTTIGSCAFSGCEKLSSLTLPNNITHIENNVFSGCEHLSAITIPSSVTTIESGAFSGCKGLTSVTIPNSVTVIGDSAFTNCEKLSSLTLPNSITIIKDSAFFGCDHLSTIAIPDGVTYIGKQAFACCDLLSTITIPDSVTHIGAEAFAHCSSLKSIVLPNGVTNIGKGLFYYCSSLTSVTLPDSVTAIEKQAFLGCKALTTATLPKNLNSIGEEAFCLCSLTSVTIPSHVTKISPSAFSCSGCKSLTILPGIRIIEEAAFDNGSFASVTIPDSVTTIEKNAFTSSCLKSATIPNSVTNIDAEAFPNRKDFTIYTFPDSYAEQWAKKAGITVKECDEAIQMREQREKEVQLAREQARQAAIEAYNAKIQAQIADVKEKLCKQEAVYAENAKKLFGAGAKLKKDARNEMERLQNLISDLKAQLK